VSETLLSAANTIFAIVEAFTDTEKLVVGLSSATSLLSARAQSALAQLGYQVQVQKVQDKIFVRGVAL
jgi:hypothetical protein